MDGLDFERAVERCTGYRRSSAGDPFDLLDSSGHHAIETKALLRGTRDLNADALQLAAWVAERPSRRASILVHTSEVSESRLEEEWKKAGRALRSDLAGRLSLIVLDPRIPGFKPNLPWLKRVREGLGTPSTRSDPLPRPESITPKIFEIQKVLFTHGLLGHRPTPIHRLIQEAGSSYPMVVKALKRLEGRKALDRSSNRSVALRSFPSEIWAEMVAVSNPFRRTIGYRDVTGKSDPGSLLRRLNKLRPKGVALGGVHAARYWDPHFNLHGTPRLDLSVHLAPGPGELDFVKALDPALKPVEVHAQEPVLVVHPLIRGESFFKQRDSELPFADPVETLLDLHEMRLAEQAEELIERLSKKRTGEPARS